VSGNALDTFLELVRVDSPTGRESQVAIYCENRLVEMGFEVRIDDSAALTGSDTGNLIATRQGVDCSMTLILSAHMDCVEPCVGVVPVIDDGIVRSAGPTVLGADDKAGIAAILAAISRVLEEGGPRPALRVILTTAEESGLTGAKALSPDVLKADLAVVLDAAGDPGGIVVGAPTHYTFEAQFTGIASHAGVAPEKGVSALEMAAAAVCAMDLGRIDQHTTANIGTITGGTATNVVPAHASMKGECRSLRRDAAERQRDSMNEIIMAQAQAFGGGVDIAWTLEYSGFTVDQDSPQLAMVMAACRDAAVEPSVFTTGGGSDGNVFAAAGVPTFVLGCGMHEVHSVEEHIKISDLNAVVDILTALIRRLARG